MSRVSSTQALLPSVLDRLRDANPDSATDPPVSQSQVLRELKASVCRDLTNLLNTRWRCKAWPPDLEELDLSVVNYGIPDFTGANMGASADRETFRATLERVIARFEPRLRRPRITLLDDDHPTDRTLRFRLDATLVVRPAPDEPVTFDTRLEPVTGNFKVQPAAVRGG